MHIIVHLALPHPMLPDHATGEATVALTAGSYDLTPLTAISELVCRGVVKQSI